jgi:hypothetical protein
MENKFWRWVGIFLICSVAFSAGYSFGFVKGGQETFDFFIAFVDYSVDNGILKMEIDTQQLSKYLEIAKKYCFKHQGSGSLNIDCGENS